MSVIIPILLVLHVTVCLLLVLIVLMQLPRSEGLGTAFGGGMTQDILGANATSFLSKFTVWLGVAFFALTLLLAVSYAKRDSGSSSPIQKEILGTAPLAASTTEALPSATPASALSPAPAVEGAPSATPAADAAATPAPSPVASPAASVAP